MKKNQTLPPIDSHPDFVREAQKLTRYRDALSEAQAEKTAMGRALAVAQRARHGARDAIAEADRLLTGTASAPDEEDRFVEACARVKTLEAAVHAQSVVAESARRRASREVAIAAAPAHRELVGRIMGLVQELHALNREEQAHHRRLEEAGYVACLPSLSFEPPRMGNLFDLRDPTGGYAVDWGRRAAEHMAG